MLQAILSASPVGHYSIGAHRPSEGVRAILLASATTTTLKCRRCSKRAIQLLRAQRVMTALAPLINKLRK